MRHQRRHRTVGFTVVELLVVLSIVGVSLALTLPAVQKARGQARRARCQNNLKQIALALHNYHDVNATFAPGWTAHHPVAGPDLRLGWQCSLLPFLEQSQIYDQLDFSNVHDTSVKLLQTKIPVYRCPSDSTPNVNALRGNYGTSNYSANHGSEPLPRWLPGRMSPYWPGHTDTPKNANGIMFWNSMIRLRDVKDGSSNTIMVGERCVTSAAGIWPGVGGNHFENDAVTECSHASRPNHSVTSFSSRHGRGVHIVLCDGAARYITNDIDSSAGKELGTYQKLGNRDDSQPIGEY